MGYLSKFPAVSVSISYRYLRPTLTYIYRNSKLRQQFNENHVGRRTKNFYDKHADHARKQYMAYEKFRLQSDYHNRSIGKVSGPHYLV